MRMCIQHSDASHKERALSFEQLGPEFLSQTAMIVKPPKARRWPDSFIQPIHGTHGPCALCRRYSKLTDDHIPPESVGNFGRWEARSYLAASTANQDLLYGRRFNGGVRFRTLCADCNNRLGATEDKTVAAFFESIRKLIESPIILTSTLKVTTKPNQLYKGLLAHLVAANDNGIPNSFDVEARELFWGRRPLLSSTWSLFYWIFVGPELFIMRNAYHTVWHPTVEVRAIMLLKLYPLALCLSKSHGSWVCPICVCICGTDTTRMWRCQFSCGERTNIHFGRLSPVATI